ncbi:MAG: MotA/TolQ/ExbB proton channel family protein [bacterium]
MIDIFVKGGFMMYPILLCSVVALGIVIERFVCLHAAEAAGRRFLAEAVGVGKGPDRARKIGEIARRIPSPVSAIVGAAADSVGRPEGEKNAAVWSEGRRQRRELEGGVAALGVIAQISPLMGLLGTVIGMIRAFMMIQTLGGQVEATHLAGGIWEALITTAAGLSVAIPALIFHHYFEGRIGRIQAAIADSAAAFPDIMGGCRLGSGGPEKRAED